MSTHFSVANKVALITGGATGIGYFCAIGLLENGAKGVSIADIDEEAGLRAVQTISEKFSEYSILFVKTDVTDITQFEDAFQNTVEAFGQVDILVNNAGILDDDAWEKIIDVNVKGTVNGILLGLENYLQNNRSTDEAVILNISSTKGIRGSPDNPIYSCTKFAVNGMALSWGLPVLYEETKVKVISVCPGSVTSDITNEMPKENLDTVSNDVTQTEEEVASGIVQVIERAKTGTIWVIEGGELAHQYVLPSISNMEKVYIK
ncbi:15-hydroxyprostaglandin dehydrogenase [NAD(+)]-like [Sitophilus oryzae]|uniref:15-hydroxyprostaglandin dehydrogenase [NAD(+)]-like n=1 Tax=Sitophilus oryzae TaxID=7048 RepID=A0A6J2XDH2_SITOR|nr:15-hydroxyprostaglandin dehydrogenase [NAD(+)]-like [Sitophilus oryzae]